MLTHKRLEVEELERRDTPTSVGLPWVDPLHLTLSLAPDGTGVSTSVSTLNQALSDQVPVGDWRLEVLRAFQTWAASANVNVGLVADGGQPLGTPGLAQGDPRFGDIRVAATALTTNAVALGTPFQPNGSTWSGDVLLNTAYRFGVGDPASYDLFSTLLHEAGHVFGLGDNSDPSSVMYSNYAGLRAGPSPQDVAALQALYGARKADAYDAKSPNGDLKSASPLGASAGAVAGDVTTPDDVDYYKFSAPPGVVAGATFYVQLQTSGLSLLVPSLTVYDGSGAVVGSAAAGDPLGGYLTIPVTATAAGAVYYARVGNATQSVFGVGSYQLTLGVSPGNSGNTPAGFLNPDNKQNDTLKTATKLTGRNSGGTGLDYGYSASISAPSDLDFYKVHSQAAVSGARQELIALASSSDVGGLAPRVDVYDAAFNPVPAQVIGNDRGFFSVQVLNPVSDSDYYVKVSTLAPPDSPHAVGSYYLGVNFNLDQSVSLQAASSGTLTAGGAQQVQTLTVSKSGPLNLVLSADAGGWAGAAQVQMRVYDAGGNLVFRLVAFAGQPASSGVAYLGQGTYTVAYAAVSQGLAPPPISYGLAVAVLGDPIGPTLVGSVDTTPPVTVDYFWDGPGYVGPYLVYGWITPYYLF